MLSARAILQEIRGNEECYRLFLSVAAHGEGQGGWENERLALRLRDRDPQLAAKVLRHGRDESKHQRLFLALLAKRGLEPAPVPLELDYTLLLTRAGIGLDHERLRGEEPAGLQEVIAYLVHGRVTEQRGAEEIALQSRVFADDPELGRAIRLIADDEVAHLSHCHEELLGLVAQGHGGRIRRMLAHYAQVEIRVYRDVSLAMMERMARQLAWPAWKSTAIRLGIHAGYWLERLYSWRRMVGLRPPRRPNALGEPAPRRASAA